jgi:cytochrome c oxidase subunit 3
MPGTSVIDDIELIIEDIRGGGGKPPSRRDDGDGGDDGGNSGGDRKPEPGRSSPKKYSTAIALAMLSILMFFMVLTAAFVVLRINNLHTWSAIRLPWILWVNTAVLLLSSATLELARRKLQVNSLRGFKQMWALTTILGMIFLSGQVIAWRHLAVEGVTSRLSSSFFYVFTALHAAHLFGGICALLYVGLRNFESAHVSRWVAAEVTSYYWHFMDGLWLFLLALLYFGQ